MTFSQFQALAFRTCKQLSDHAQNCVHMAFGMCTEIFELALEFGDKDDDVNKENCIKEIGDILWYLAGLCTFEDYDFSRGANFAKLKNGEGMSYIASAYKANWAHGKPIDRERVQEAIYNFILELDEASNDLSVTLSQIMYRNIHKLKVRYPDVYADELSVNKDETME